MSEMSLREPQPGPKYVWPRYVLAAVVLFFLLAIIWMWREVERVKRVRQDNARPPVAGGALLPGATNR